MTRFLPILLLLIASAGQAGQAYTWTDGAGVTHFSESVPPGVQAAERVELQHAPVIPGPPPGRYRSISEQAARLQAAREKREQQREKRRLIEAKRRQLEAEAEAAYEPQEHHYFYPYPYWNRHHPRHPHHRPRHPGKHYPPPRHEFQPGKTITQQRNQEALRSHRYRW